MTKIIQKAIKFFSIPEHTPKLNLRKTRIINGLVNLVIMIVVVYLPILININGILSVQVLAGIILLAAFFFFRYMINAGASEILTPFLLWTTWGTTTSVFIFIENGLRAPAYSAFVVFFVVFASLLGGRRQAFTFSGITILIGLITVVLENYGWVITPSRVPSTIMALAGQIIFLVAVNFLLIFLEGSKFNGSIAEQENEKKSEIDIELSRARNEVTELQEELQAFIYSISHDLRAPLRAMVSFSDILQEDYGQHFDQTGNQYLEKINSSGLKLADMLNDMLILSRINSAVMNRTRFQLAEMVEAVFIKELNNHRDREIIYHPAANPTVYADIPLIEAVITQLISNAIKFSVEKESAKIEFGIVIENNEETYYIKDNGIGFDMQYASKAFEPFQRLHSQKEFSGSGVGLAIVRRIIKRHGGKVWIHSTPDIGTTVYFTIPKP